MIHFRKTMIVCAIAVGLSVPVMAQASEWSDNEVRFKYGDRVNPITGEEAKTTVVTLQHASGWKYGENSYFVDYVDDDRDDGFNDKSFYSEWYSFLGTSNLFGISYPELIRDAGVVAGINASGEARTLKYLPGVQVNWDIPGFVLFNTMATLYIDDSAGVAGGGAPREDDSYMIDVAWKYLFLIANQRFSFEGHAEFIAERDLANMDGKAKDWILAQPQLRWDLGYALSGAKDRVYLGVEHEFWENKLGQDETDNNLQATFIWKF